jgi:hypothetical protein
MQTLARGEREFAHANAKSWKPAMGTTHVPGSTYANKFNAAKGDAVAAGQKFRGYNQNWNNYVNSFQNPLARGGLRAAGAVTGTLYNAPRTLLFDPRAAGGITGAVATYTGLPLAIKGLTGEDVNVDPYSRIGQIGYGLSGRAEGDVRRGALQGADTAVSNVLGAYSQSGMKDRYNFLYNGGINGLSRYGYGSQASNPSTARQFMDGQFSPEFFRDRAYGRIKSGSIFKPVAGAFKAVGNKYKALPTGVRRQIHNVNSWGVPAAFAGMGVMAGYGGSRDAAYMGGQMAGNDLALEGMQNKFNNLGFIERAGALIAPQYAANQGWSQYQQMRSQFGQGANNTSTPYRFGATTPQQRVGAMYFRPDGTASY